MGGARQDRDVQRPSIRRSVEPTWCMPVIPPIAELQKVLRNAKPQQLSSHSTIAAAEQLLKCLQRDGATAAHPSTPSTSAKPGSNYGARNTETQMQGSSWSSAF